MKRKVTGPTIIYLAVLFNALLVPGCAEKPETHTIGIVNTVPVLDDTITGFKQGMAELG